MRMTNASLLLDSTLCGMEIAMMGSLGKKCKMKRRGEDIPTAFLAEAHSEVGAGTDGMAASPPRLFW